MRVLILHASLGSGHVSAAAAVEAELVARGVEVRSEDALQYTNAAMRTFVKTIITQFSQESPDLYRLLYEGTDSPDPEETMEQNASAGRIQAHMYNDLLALIEEYQPDRIICAQQIPALVVHALSASGRIDIPWYIIVTDYMAHSSWILTDVDGYFVPWSGVKRMLASWGIPSETITVSGIPVKAEATIPKDPREMRTKHGIAPDGPVVVAIASGIKTPRFVTAIGQLAAHLGHGSIIVVAGRNEDVNESLAELPTPAGVTIQTFGFIDFLDDLIAAADVVISKSGGLITTEVITRGIPLVVFDPFPGQEEWNADFVTGSGAGFQIRIPAMVGPAVSVLLADPEALKSARTRSASLARPDAARIVAETVIAGQNCD